MSNATLAALYPEVRAGGFARDDQRYIFFLRVNALLRPDMTVLDYGAGRGAIADAKLAFARQFQTFRGRCRRVYGADIDPAVLGNPTIDKALLIQDGRIPLPDASVDLIVSNATFEHISDPDAAARELERVLKPGGWICAWTVSKFGYVALGAQVVPNKHHARAVRMLGGKRGAQDVFPTCYRMNTISALRKAFPPDRFLHCSYYLGGTPGYNAGRTWLARAWKAYNSIAPGPLKKNLHVFIQKRA